MGNLSKDRIRTRYFLNVNSMQPTWSFPFTLCIVRMSQEALYSMELVIHGDVVVWIHPMMCSCQVGITGTTYQCLSKFICINSTNNHTLWLQRETLWHFLLHMFKFHK
jgi:hypothetical protein